MAYLLPFTIQQFLDQNAVPAAGCLAHVYAINTTTNISTYTTDALSVANANPLVADSSGRFSNAYVANGTDMTVVITDSLGSTTFEQFNDFAPDTFSATGIPRTYETKSADYTLVAGDNAKVQDYDAAGADRTVTANSLTLGNGFWITIGKSSATGLVTIAPGGGQTVDGAASYILDTQNETITIVSMGAAGWRMTSRTADEPIGELPNINAQVASYQLVLSDKGKKVTMNVAGANNLTIPSNATAAFPLYSRVEITQIGAGQTTLVAAGGVSLFSFGSSTANLGWLKILGQNAGVIATKTAVNTWLIEGNLTA